MSKTSLAELVFEQLILRVKAEIKRLDKIPRPPRHPLTPELERWRDRLEWIEKERELLLPLINKIAVEDEIEVDTSIGL